jgi:hypothetical protein
MPYSSGPTLKPYIYSLVSYLFIKQDQRIMTCNSAVASLMLSQFFLLLLLSEACPDHNFFVFPDRAIIFGMWVHDHKVVCHIP